MKKAISLLMCLLVLAAAGCDRESSYMKNAVDTATDTSWSLVYDQFDGERAMTEDAAEFIVVIVTEEGSLGVTITGADGAEYYKGSELPTSTFTVEAQGEGPCEIRLDADHHRGSFTVT